MRIGERLKELRGALSQAEAAKRIGVAQQGWARYESGSVAPGADALCRICSEFGVASDWLLGLDERKPMNTLGNRLKELRGSRSQKEMGASLGIQLNAWARYERGEVMPGADMLAKICTTLGVSADWLLDIPGEHSAPPVSVRTGWEKEIERLRGENAGLKFALKSFADLLAASKEISR